MPLISYEEIIDFIAAGTTPEAVVAFRPSENVQRRVAELVERSKNGSMSAETNIAKPDAQGLNTLGLCEQVFVSYPAEIEAQN